MLKLNVGFNKKVGDANYGSRGANVNLELELDSNLINEPDRLRERVRQLFLLAKSSVNEELGGSHEKSSDAANGVSQCGPRSGNQSPRDGTRRATASQVRAIQAIADRQQIDLTVFLRDRFDIDEAGELTITEASRLIDELKAHANGAGAEGSR